MLLFVKIDSETAISEYEKVYNYLIDLGSWQQFVSGLSNDDSFGYYFDYVRGKRAIKCDDPGIIAIYRIERTK